MIRDSSVSLEPLRDAVIGVIGYGNQGRAQARNLRDGGFVVRIGLRPDGSSSRQALADGFAVESIAAVAAASDVLMLLLPDEVIASVFAGQVRDSLKQGCAVGLAHGAALVFDTIDIPAGIDVVLVAPTGPGVELRARFVAGHGIPAVVAVHRDATGLARDRALAYARAIGCTRAGVVETTVRDEAVVDVFGEQAVLCGGLAELVGTACETLVEAGYPAELAYLECVHQIRLTAELISRFGLDGMWDRISPTARFGGLESGPRIVGETSRRAMREVLEGIESGDFFARFIADARSGGTRLARMRTRARKSALEEAGDRLRRAFEEAENRG